MKEKRIISYFYCVAVLVLATAISIPTKAQSPIPTGSVRIHYHRNNADYAGWAIYDWTGAKSPSPSYANPGNPQTGTDDFGVYWDIALADRATQLFFIVRNADGSRRGRRPVGRVADLWPILGFFRGGSVPFGATAPFASTVYFRIFC